MSYHTAVIIWFFFLYSFLGWVGEVCTAAFHKKKFVNRGFVNGPLCPIYGVASVLFILFLSDLVSSPFFLFLAGSLLATVLEYSTGKLLEKIFHKKLWNYSAIRFNLDGYICVRYSILWGVLAVLVMLFINPFLSGILTLIPSLLSAIVLWTLSVLLALDFLSTSLAVLGMRKEAARFAHLTEGLQQTSYILENALTKKVQSRMERSFPAIDLRTLSDAKPLTGQKKKGRTVFAEGCGFYKLVSLFFLSAFLGDITETIFCLATTNRLMSRSSVVYGPFSLVWGLGCAMLTALLYRYKDKSDRFIFFTGTLLGGMYEYICSVFTERVFGTIFWDYSGFTFNLGGRINLLYCFFWGFAAVVWLKFCYPFLSHWIEKLPIRLGTVLCNLMILFMVFDIGISGLALGRYTERHSVTQDITNPLEGQESGETPETADTQDAAESRLTAALNSWLDEHFDDERIERIYPNMKIVGAD